jgi:hypothetical protein
MTMRRAVGIACLVWALIATGSMSIGGQAPPPDRELLTQYCTGCHNDRLKTGGLSLAALDPAHVDLHAPTWENVVRKLRAGAMPPPGARRPERATMQRFVTNVERSLDSLAMAHPNPGQIPVHRLNRSEYANAVRDILAIEIDPRQLLPADDVDAHGFDNNAGVLSVSPALLERYVSAARAVARMAIGDPAIVPGFETYAVSKMMLQDDRLNEELPFGSRGGLAVKHHFPLDGTYAISIRLQRQLYDYIRGLGEPHALDVRIDGTLVQRFTVGGESRGRPAPATYAGNIQGSREWEDYMHDADALLQARVAVPAGTRTVGVSFVKELYELEDILQPRVTGFTIAVDEKWDGYPAIESIAVGGPYDATPPTRTESRRRLFVCTPRGRADETACAERIISSLVRRAYRRPATKADADALAPFYREGRREAGFDAGIQRVLERVLSDPEFLFRIERTPRDAPANGVRRVSGIELASRLSFFLWSSVPDEELLTAAVDGTLGDAAVLMQQVQRMLADSRSHALVDNFASQWLAIRAVRSATPDPDIFPDFDDNLRDAFEQETSLFVDSQLREDRSLVDLLTADYTFVNERLARHYGIPHVYGERFRRVALGGSPRRGLLGQGSILTATSYANRTSPVLRGKWVLDNLLGSPPPPPPADVPSLVERSADGKPRSMRERMEQHRANPACASCHRRMDPLGFALENFDAIGAWRSTSEAGTAIDATDRLPDGAEVRGLDGIRHIVIEQKEEFVRTVTEKLLTYALGRGLEWYDYPSVRAIVRGAAQNDYRWSSIIVGVVNSLPFEMRRSES